MLKSIRFLNLYVLILIWTAPFLRAQAEQIARPVRADKSQTASPVVAPKPAARENYLGVFTDPVPKALAFQKAGLLVEYQGVLVKYVLPNSPADKAGLKPNDILTAYDNTKLSSPQQLKRLIVRDRLSRPVRVSVVRGAELRTVNVSLAERTVNWTHGLAGVLEIRVPRVVRLTNRGGVPVFVPQDRMFISGSDVRWEIRITEPPTAPQKSATVEVENQAILITTSNGSSFQLDLSLFNKDGPLSSAQYEGTTEEIQLQIVSDATILSDDVKTSLDWAKSQVKRQRTIQIRFQPRMHGTKHGVRILMSRPEGEQTIRCLQCDHYFDENQPMEAAALLSVEPFINELRRLPLMVRQKVESTLRNTSLPTISFNVERSQ